LIAYSSRVSVLEQRVEGIDFASLISRLGRLCASSVGHIEGCFEACCDCCQSPLSYSKYKEHDLTTRDMVRDGAVVVFGEQLQEFEDGDEGFELLIVDIIKTLLRLPQILL
jgi:hypothetical protein